jgi:hypothetical protein
MMSTPVDRVQNGRLGWPFDRCAAILEPRLRYAWIFGAATWCSWLATLAVNGSLAVPDGLLFGLDYLAFYTAGLVVRQGDSARLYDAAFLHELQRELVGIEGVMPFLNPPFFAYLFVPLALVPFAISLCVWTAASFAGLWLSFRALGAPRPLVALNWSLCFLPVFATIKNGQNSILTLVLFCLTYRLLRSHRPFAAGFVAGCLVYKPQLLLGLGVLWALEWRRYWRAIVGLALAGSLWAGLCWIALPEASREYVHYSRTTLSNILDAPNSPARIHHTVRACGRLLFGNPALADAIHAVGAAVGIGGFVWLWRRQEGNLPVLFAASVLLLVWTTPYALIHDWTVLLIPAVLLYEHAPQLRSGWIVLHAAVFLASYVSMGLVRLQQHFLGLAVQISVPVLFLSIVTAAWWLTRPENTRADLLESES